MIQHDQYNIEQYIPEEDSFYAVPKLHRSPVQPMYFNRKTNTLLKDDSPMNRFKEIVSSIGMSIIEIPICTIKSIFKR